MTTPNIWENIIHVPVTTNQKGLREIFGGESISLRCASACVRTSENLKSPLASPCSATVFHQSKCCVEILYPLVIENHHRNSGFPQL